MTDFSIVLTGHDLSMPTNTATIRLRAGSGPFLFALKVFSEVIQALSQTHRRVGAIQRVDVQARGTTEDQAFTIIQEFEEHLSTG